MISMEGRVYTLLAPKVMSMFSGCCVSGAHRNESSASQNGHVDVVRLLCERCPMQLLLAKDNNEKTCLHDASYEGLGPTGTTPREG